MKICFLVNTNQYESKRHFTRYLREALERQEIETEVIDVLEKSIDYQTLKQIEDFAPDLTASFNFINPISEHNYLWDYLKLPHLMMLVDPAIYYIDLIRSPWAILSTVDAFDAHAIYSQNFKNVFLLHHAVEREVAFAEESPEKIYDVVFIGSCYDYETLRSDWREKCDKKVSEALDAACEMVLGDNRTTIAQALVNVWNQFGLEISSQTDFLSYFYFIDYYTRGKDRIDLIRAIDDRVKVHIFGELSTNFHAVKDWFSYLSMKPNIVIHPPLNFPDSLQVLKKSKIVLNSMPFFKYGSHERLFTGFGSGALVVTQDNLFVRDCFVDGEDMVFYQSGQWDEIKGKVNDYLQDEEKRRSVVAKGRAKVQKFHTWDERAKTLKDMLPKALKQVGDRGTSGENQESEE